MAERLPSAYLTIMRILPGTSVLTLLPLIAALTALCAAPAFAACGGRVQTGNGASALALAQRCGTTLGDLRRANPGLNLNTRLHGQVVKVPDARKPGYIPEAVRRGAPPASSVIGPIPHSHPAINPRDRRSSREDRRKVVIRRGDTLSGIASAAGLTLNALVAANPDVDPRRLAVGQTIVLPNVD